MGALIPSLFRGLLIAVNWISFGWFMKAYSTEDVNDVATKQTTWTDKVVAIIYLLTLIAVVYLLIVLYKKYIKKSKYGR